MPAIWRFTHSPSANHHSGVAMHARRGKRVSRLFVHCDRRRGRWRHGYWFRNVKRNFVLWRFPRNAIRAGRCRGCLEARFKNTSIVRFAFRTRFCVRGRVNCGSYIYERSIDIHGRAMNRTLVGEQCQLRFRQRESYTPRILLSRGWWRWCHGWNAHAFQIRIQLEKLRSEIRYRVEREGKIIEVNWMIKGRTEKLLNDSTMIMMQVSKLESATSLRVYIEFLFLGFNYCCWTQLREKEVLAENS